ncbi:tetratricopeptide repeat protein [Methylobacterium currus]|uniref:tetratricopeptide repeat protein n=1 Tax=Methylobacterium currus TaxID=2051553 RepID=UPI0013E00BED|nr:tetratricopeptide repeat protein [Methylobacterium currus]
MTATPGDVEAWLRRGADLVRTGRPAEAERCFRAALALEPGDGRASAALAGTLVATGRLGEAEPPLRAALARNPLAAPLHAELGLLLLRLARPDEAARAFREAVRLRPDHARTHARLGAALNACGRKRAAERSYRQALAHAPDDAFALLGLGGLLLGRREFAPAAACFRAALGHEPAAHRGLGLALSGLGAREEAVRHLDEALRLDPADAGSALELGSLHATSGRPEAALAAYERAGAFAPHLPEAHLGIGIASALLGRFEAAEAALREALRLRPDSVEALSSLGDVLRNRGRLDEAEATLRSALRLRPQDADAAVHLSFVLLQAGRHAEGWCRHEARWAATAWRGRRRPLACPPWRGEPLGRRRLLLHAEQGLGDTIQFCRFVPLVAGAARLRLAVPAALAGLLRDSDVARNVEVTGSDADGSEDDLALPLMSLPARLGITETTIPSAPYLRADAGKTEAWRRELGVLDGLRVGLVWAGDPTMAADARRSLPLGRLASLADVPGLRLVSLQVGPAARQIAETGLPILDAAPRLADLTDTAALVAALDLVVGVDTAVLHLAGALGRPAWLMNRFDTCWRWGGTGATTPWYPSMRIVRQPAPGAWDPVIAQVRTDLRRLAAER